MPHNMRWLGWGEGVFVVGFVVVVGGVVYDAVVSGRLAVVVAEEWEE